MTGLGTISVHAERLPISDPRRKPNQSILNRWLKAPSKRSQNFDTAYRNIVGAFGHHVATCCDTLGVVGSFENGQNFHATFVDVCNSVAPGHAY